MRRGPAPDFFAGMPDAVAAAARATIAEGGHVHRWGTGAELREVQFFTPGRSAFVALTELHGATVDRYGDWTWRPDCDSARTPVAPYAAHLSLVRAH